MRDVSPVGEYVINMDRKYTDVHCCIILVCFFLITVGFAFHGVINGDPLLQGVFDLDGNSCGASPDEVKEFKFLYFPDIKAKTKALAYDQAVCVKSCPKKDEAVECFDTSYKKDRCKDGVLKATYDSMDFIRFCLP